MFFAYLFFSSLKQSSAICHIQLQWKVTEHFRNRILKKYGVIVEKNRYRRKRCGNKKTYKHFFAASVHVKLATVQIWRQTNNSCSFQTVPKRSCGRLHLDWVQHRGFGWNRQIFDEFPDSCLAISSTKPAFHAVTVLQGNRSVYLLNLDTEASSNELTVETHPVKSRLVVCAANVSPAVDSWHSYSLSLLWLLNAILQNFTCFIQRLIFIWGGKRV